MQRDGSSELRGDEMAGMDSPAASEPAPASRPTAAQRRALYEREEVDRRQAAEERAERLIQAARDGRRTSRIALGNVARRVAATLGVEQCDLIVLGVGDRAVLVQLRAGARARPTASDAGGVAVRGDEPLLPSSAELQIRTVRFSPTDSPLTFVRGDARAHRVHVFMNHALDFRPLGILTIECAAERRLSSDERAFANAVGDRLAAAITRGDFPKLV
jgi:hypothetical protein